MRATHFLQLLLWPVARLGLRAQLLLLLALLAAFLIGDRLREIAATREAALLHTRQEMLHQAEHAAEQQAEIVGEARALLQLAAALPHSARHSGQACTQLFRRMVAERPWLTSMSVFDGRGQMFCTSSERLLNDSIADRPYFQAATEQQDFVLSDYIISRLTHKPVVIGAMPRLSGERVESVLVAAMNIDWLSRAMARAVRGPGSEMLLVDGSGTVLAAFPEPDKWVGMDIRFSSLKPLLDSADGVTRWKGFDGRARIIGHARLPGTRASIVAMQSEAAVLAEPRRQARYALAKLGATSLLCLFFIWLGGEWLIIRPLQGLTRSVERLGSGDFSARVPTAGLSPELARLSSGFNAMADRLAEQDAALRQTNAQLSDLASTDGLTSLANRRQFDERLEAERSRAVRDRKPLALILIDVDHFKKFNDRYGHLPGDDCLRKVAEVFRDAARRPGDLASRTGGEEFALLLPGANLADAVGVAEAVRAKVEALGLEHLDNAGGKVTVSCGVAALGPRQDQSLRSLLDAADAALYRAKREGRNRVARAEARLPLAS